MNACPRRKDVVCCRAKNVTYSIFTSLWLWWIIVLANETFEDWNTFTHKNLYIYLIGLALFVKMRVRVVTAGQYGREENRELSKHFINLQVKNFINVYVSSMMFRAEDILWTQASAKAVSRSGAVFFGLVNDTSIGCWNEFRSLNRENIVSSHV